MAVVGVSGGEAPHPSTPGVSAITPAVLDKALDLAHWYAVEVVPSAAEGFRFAEAEMRKNGARLSGTVDKAELERDWKMGAFGAFSDLMLKHVPALLRLLFKRRWAKTYPKFSWRDGGECAFLQVSKARSEGCTFLEIKAAVIAACKRPVVGTLML